jgi:hypothetical protein
MTGMLCNLIVAAPPCSMSEVLPVENLLAACAHRLQRQHCQLGFRECPPDRDHLGEVHRALVPIGAQIRGPTSAGSLSLVEFEVSEIFEWSNLSDRVFEATSCPLVDVRQSPLFAKRRCRQTNVAHGAQQLNIITVRKYCNQGKQFGKRTFLEFCTVDLVSYSIVILAPHGRTVRQQWRSTYCASLPKLASRCRQAVANHLDMPAGIAEAAAQLCDTRGTQ